MTTTEPRSPASDAGGACVNGTIVHTLSRRRSVHTCSTRIDPAMLYPPFTDKLEALLRKGFGLGDPLGAIKKLRATLAKP